MPDYKEMYLIMVRASEKALRHMEAADAALIEAQRRCEELYLQDELPEGSAEEESGENCAGPQA